MADIFLSYASADRKIARRLASALRSSGWSVFIDVEGIRTGAKWREALDDALREAGCILVLWSGSSVTSDHVRYEARYGLKRDVLVQAFIEHVDQRTLDREFEERQIASLIGRDLTPHGLAKSPLIEAVNALVPRTLPRIANQRAVFTGRGPELDRLLSTWWNKDRIRSELVNGLAGIGKSRLMQELWNRIAMESNDEAILIVGRNSPETQGVPFHLAGDLLRNYLEFGADELDEADRPTIGPFISRLVGQQRASDVSDTLTTAQVRESTVAAFGTWIEDLVSAELAPPGRRKRFLFVVEDLQWIDPTSKLVIDHAIRAVDGTGSMLVMTHRPQFQAPPAWRASTTTLTIEPLLEADARSFVDRVSGNSIPEELSQRIREKAERVPLYLEELTRHAVASGDDREYTALGNDSLNDRLQTTLTGLPGESSHLARCASLLGRSFDLDLLYSFLGEIAYSHLERADSQIDILLDSGILQRGPGLDDAIMFKHSLIWESAYAMVDARDRERWHSAAAALITRKYPDLAASEPEVLARHYGAAGDIEAAVDHWRNAGRIKSALSAHAEAAGLIKEAIEQVQTVLPGGDSMLEADLQTDRGRFLIAAESYAAEGVEAAYSRAIELTRSEAEKDGSGDDKQLGDAVRQFRAQIGLASYLLIRGQVERCRQLCESSLELAKDLSDGERVVALSWRGTADFYLGRIEEARRDLEDACARYEGSPGHRAFTEHGLDPRVLAESHLLWIYTLSGQLSEARSLSEQMVRAFDGSGQFMTDCHARNFAAVARLWMGDLEGAAIGAEKLVELARKHSLPHYEAYGLITQGRALAAIGHRSGNQGRVTEGEQLIIDGQEKRSLSGAKLAFALHRGLLMETRLERGSEVGIEGPIRDARDQLEQNGEEWWRPEMDRLEAVHRKRLGDKGSAERLLRGAARSSRALGFSLIERRVLAEQIALTDAGESRRSLEADLRSLVESVPELKQAGEVLPLISA